MAAAPTPARGCSTTELYGGRLTRRGATRVHRLAWTVADLRGVDRPGVAEVDVALRLRTGDPLLRASRCAAAGAPGDATRTGWPGSR